MTKSEVFKRKVDTRDKLLARNSGAAATRKDVKSTETNKARSTHTRCIVY